MTREELKKLINREIKNDTKSYILNLATGYGKSALSLHIVNKVKIRQPTILLLVAERAHKDNWKVEMDKFLKRKAKVRIECYQSLSKLKGMKFDFVIADEAHHLNTKARLDYFSLISFSYSVFLSATYKVNFKNYLMERYGSVDFSVDLQTAIDNNTLPTPRILVLKSKIPVTERIYEIRIGRANNPQVVYCEFPEYRKKKIAFPYATIIAKATFRECCNYYAGLREYYSKQLVECFNKATKDKYLNAVLKEKRFLGENKTAILSSYAENFRKKNKRFLIFATSIAQAQSLGNALTSKTKKPKQVIDDFNSFKTNELITVNMLQEGQNLVNTEVGFIAQVDSSDRSIIQKVGRLLRHPKPTVVIHYFEGTIEETYTLNAINDNFSSDYVEFKELKLV